MASSLWAKWHNIATVSAFTLLLLFIYTSFDSRLEHLETDKAKLKANLLGLAHNVDGRVNQLAQETKFLSSAGSAPAIAPAPMPTADRRTGWDPNDVIIVYNRVPKTGSTSFMGITYDLTKPNGFHAVHLNLSKNSHVMSLADQAKFVENITNWRVRRPAIYHGHVAFIDFARFGATNPVYINIIREPLERLVSYYYFLRYGDDFRPYLTRKKAGDTQTFDDCVAANGRDCKPELMWLQVPFFCGHAAECWNPGSQWALEQAKLNLVNHYLLVGVTDEMLDFVAMLEAILPKFFKGATQSYITGTKSTLRKTAKKLDPRPETVQLVQASAVWRVEHEFYEFALEQFHFLKKSILHDHDREGVPIVRPRAFHFEKVRPGLKSLGHNDQNGKKATGGDDDEVEEPDESVATVGLAEKPETLDDSHRDPPDQKFIMQPTPAVKPLTRRQVYEDQLVKGGRSNQHPQKLSGGRLQKKTANKLAPQSPSKGVRVVVEH